MSIYRYLSTAAKSTVHSSIVKQLSKFSSHNELIEYAQRPIEYCYPKRMITACAPDRSTGLSLIGTASDLRDQLLVRLAHCLEHFQSIPFLPGVNPTLLSLHERYLKLFENLVTVPRIQSQTDEKKFFDVINAFIIQNNDVIGLLSAGCSEAQKYFKSYRVMEDFLDNVLRLRLSMRLLSEHYLELHKQYENPSTKNDDYWRGAICMRFNPRLAIQQCIEDVSAICFETYSVVPHVHIEDNLNESFPYFPAIVEYVLREILKNSMRALVETNKMALGNIHHVKQYFDDHRDKPLCKVIVTADPTDEHFTIAVRDQGGGIDDTDEEIFRYMFTGKFNSERERFGKDLFLQGDVKKSEGMKEEEANIDILADFQERMVQS